MPIVRGMHPAGLNRETEPGILLPDILNSKRLLMEKLNTRK
jgi:hypothetical protein